MADVAALAKVSVSTVSRHLNGISVRAAAAERIDRAAEALGFQPNRLAQALRGGRAGVIGLVVPDIGNPWFATLVRTIDDACRAQDLNVIVCNSDNDPQREDVLIDVLRSRQPDGLIVVSTHGIPSTSVLKHRSEGGAVVAFDNSYAASGVDVVTSDNAGGMQAMVDHLVAHSYETYVVVAGPSSLSSAAERLDSALRAIERSGGRTMRVLSSGLTFQDGVSALRELDVDSLPDAVIAVNDETALGLMQEATRRGIRIPDDVAVVGFDGVEVGAWAPSPLTTVAQDVAGLARTAVEVCLQRLEDAETPQQIRAIATSLLLRESCGCSPAIPDANQPAER